MAPPTARTESDSAAVVVINASGAAIIARVAAGTITPPRPKQATVPRALYGFSALSSLTSQWKDLHRGYNIVWGH